MKIILAYVQIISMKNYNFHKIKKSLDFSQSEWVRSKSRPGALLNISTSADLSSMKNIFIQSKNSRICREIDKLAHFVIWRYEQQSAGIMD